MLTVPQWLVIDESIAKWNAGLRIFLRHPHKLLLPHVLEPRPYDDELLADLLNWIKNSGRRPCSFCSHYNTCEDCPLYQPTSGHCAEPFHQLMTLDLALRQGTYTDGTEQACRRIFELFTAMKETIRCIGADEEIESDEEIKPHEEPVPGAPVPGAPAPIEPPREPHREPYPLIVTDLQAQTIATLIRHWLSVDGTDVHDQHDSDITGTLALCTGLSRARSQSLLQEPDPTPPIPHGWPAPTPEFPPLPTTDTSIAFEEVVAARNAFIAYLAVVWQAFHNADTQEATRIVNNCIPLDVYTIRESISSVQQGMLKGRAQGWVLFFDLEDAIRAYYGAVATQGIPETETVEILLGDRGASVSIFCHVGIDSLYDCLAQ